MTREDRRCHRRYANTETLYNQPYEDNTRVRVVRAVLRGKSLASPHALEWPTKIRMARSASKKVASSKTFPS